jgi:hypothetical protein
MVGRARLHGWLAAGALALGGCEHPVETFKPEGSAEVAFAATEQRQTLRASLANVVTVTLPPAAPATVWQIALHDTRFLKLHADLQPGRAPGGGTVVSFVALTQGTTRLRFVLVPARAEAAAPLDHRELVVTIE